MERGSRGAFAVATAMPGVVEVKVEVISAVGVVLTTEVGKLPMELKLPPLFKATRSRILERLDEVFEVEFAVLRLPGIAVAVA